jgi:predicted MFS family arabinose efflux permease
LTATACTVDSASSIVIIFPPRSTRSAYISGTREESPLGCINRGRLIATPLIGRFSDRVDKRKLLTAILGGASVFFLLFLAITKSTELTLVAFGVSLCFSSGVLSIAIHSAAAPKELSGMALGLYGTFEDLGLMVGSTIFGLSWATFGPQSVFVIASGTALAAALLALSLSHGKQ